MDSIKEEVFFESVYGWCYMMAGKFFRLYGGVSGIEFDEFFNIAYIAACRSFNNFDSCKGELENYILKCIKFELVKVISDNYRYYSQTDSIDDLLWNGMDFSEFFEIEPELDFQFFFTVDNKLKGIWKKFDERELSIIYDHYFNGKSLKKIAGELNLSPSRVSQLHAEIIFYLRDNWKDK